MTGKLEACPRLAYPHVDVKDCAKAHITALFE